MCGWAQVNNFIRLVTIVVCKHSATIVSIQQQLSPSLLPGAEDLFSCYCYYVYICFFSPFSLGLLLDMYILHSSSVSFARAGVSDLDTHSPLLL